MRDIMMNKRNPEMQDGEMDVLEQYAEMCRYQNKQRGKPEEDSLENEEENENGENKSKTENAEKEKNLEKEDTQNEHIKEMGQVVLDSNSRKHKVELLTIIGEVEGHESAPSHSKTTKYEHVLPKLAAIEDSEEIKGVLVVLNTMGGDVEAGLAIAEMVASLSKPTVSLVLGGSHSIGIPIAVSTDYSFIVPTGTMVIHPVRMTGMVIGVPQTFDYFKQMQDRITGFVSNHCEISRERLEQLMMETKMLTKDVGTILVGGEAVKEGIINEVGGIREALKKLHSLIDADRENGESK